MTEILKTQHDVIVIGAGAAGLSAALVLARARADVLVIDAGEPRNAPAAHMHGFVSRDGMPPAEFLATGRREVSSYGGTIESSTVAAIDRREDGGFDVALAGAAVHSARALLIATGLKDDLPDIPGVRERWGSVVHHCPYCHGREVSDQALGVIGGPAREMSLKQAGLLRRYSDRVDFITNGIDLTTVERHRLEAFGVRIVDGAVSRLAGEADVQVDITLTDGQTVRCDAVFIAPVPLPTDDLLRSIGCEADPTTGLIAVDAAGQTSQPGVWAAGNVVTPSAQVITAAGAGSASAIAINGWLLQKDLDTASAGRPTT
ncbi:MAG: NAD(P)/FAD-dependent oxidoreductase [Cryobacterium sp.]|nr:NAD(P)/FAD-dependent oxidoreductase [Cryobacterium sp.]